MAVLAMRLAGSEEAPAASRLYRLLRVIGSTGIELDERPDARLLPEAEEPTGGGTADLEVGRELASDESASFDLKGDHDEKLGSDGDGRPHGEDWHPVVPNTMATTRVPACHDRMATLRVMRDSSRRMVRP